MISDQTRLLTVLALTLLLATLAGAAEPPANLVTNPGFESGTAPWVARGPATLLDSTQAQTGAGGGLGHEPLGQLAGNVTGALSDIIVYVDGPAAGAERRVDNVAVVPLAGY